MGDLLNGNLFFVYLLGIIVIINYSSFTKLQKIAIIYICNYGLTFNESIKCRIVLALLIAVLFLYEEYLGPDITKRNFVVHPMHKLIDFIYMYIFQYKILYIIIAIVFRSKTFENVIISFIGNNNNSPGFLALALICFSVVFMFIGIQTMFSNPVVLNSFDQMDIKFQEYPYYFLPLSNREKRNHLFTKLEMVAEIEDYTFFQREKKYHCFSLEFIFAVFRKKRAQKKRQKYSPKKSFAQTFVKKIIFLFKKISFKNIKKLLQKKHKINVLFKYILFLFDSLKILLFNKLLLFKSTIKRLVRGYSTIEMQLIRIIGYKKGLIMGKPTSISGFYHIAIRKLYEIVYTSIFFNGKKRYLGIKKNDDFFRYYIVYIYLHTVQTTLNGKVFRPLDKIFGNIDVIDWPIEALFIITLGLNGRQITVNRISNYYHIIKKYNLSYELIYKLIQSIQ